MVFRDRRAGRRPRPSQEEDTIDIRNLLRFAALASGGLGAVLLAFAGALDEPLGLRVTLAVVVGLGLLAWAGFVTWVSINPRPALVADVIVCNLAWVAASLVFAVGAWGGWGVLFVVAQAIAVAALTMLQATARRALQTRTPA